MNNRNPLPDFDKSVYEAAAYYAMNRSESQWIWTIERKGLLSKIFDSLEDDELPSLTFYKEALKVIEQRRCSLSNIVVTNISGRLLSFCPDATMYDGLAEDYSYGFFDVSDVPPPEFWIGIYNDKLVSFIPSEFLGRAIEGVEACLGGCLEWLGDEFFINS
jgi:hypothetical protein